MAEEKIPTGEILWRPSPEIKEKSNLTAFLRSENLPDFAALLDRSNADPEWFWNALIRHYDIRFYKPYERVLDTSDGIEWPRWCVGGTTNVVLNALDRHRDTPIWQKDAVVWEAEDGKQRKWTFAEYDAEVSRLAAGLKKLGIGKGDAVGLFMPMVPEVAAALLAIAKIGGVVVPLFSGFGKQAIAVRLNDCDAKVVVTVDAAIRRGKRVPMKATLDEALDDTPSVHSVVVLKQFDETVPWNATRDHWWSELTADMPTDLPTEVMDAEAPFMVVYTSGTTGKPKGTVHSHCGFLTKVIADFVLCQDFKQSDRILWISDMGWVVGPLEVLLAGFAGATMVLVEGTPDYPDKGRIWRLVQDHKASFLGIAPTIVRIFMAHGAEFAEQYDLSSLR
ncbi:AMP-binding protein, partial [Rhodospirillaceae bacterium AH-315-P19]|nr:AMP-binding protein [Rhodospirillaceae bacterium AH-315-P19]